MQNQNNQCLNCRNFSCFYLKGIRKYVKTGLGLCVNINKEVSVDSCCKNFVSKPTGYMLKTSIEDSLNSLLIEISEIKLLLQDENKNR